MRTVVEYCGAEKNVSFSALDGQQAFYSGGVLYLKLLSQDLKIYGIGNVNAVAVLSGGLTFFQDDEKVIRAERHSW